MIQKMSRVAGQYILFIDFWIYRQYIEIKYTKVGCKIKLNWKTVIQTYTDDIKILGNTKMKTTSSTESLLEWKRIRITENRTKY